VEKTVVSPTPNTYTIEIKAIPPVAFAVPGIRKACKGDIIQFDNKGARYGGYKGARYGGYDVKRDPNPSTSAITEATLRIRSAKS
jgi:hypothetical protein